MTNTHIEKLKADLAKVEEAKEDIKELMYTAYKLEYETDKDIQTLIAKLESSNDFTFDMYQEISSWVRFNGLEKYHDSKEYLERYLQEFHCITIDWDNAALLCSVGPSIVINDQGEVYDQDGDKFFINKNDYTNANGETDINKRNELIEKYMESSGYYPNVFLAGRYGDLELVKTQ